ncbi:MAG: HEAT repeat domain-containing protein [Deltaproteobacteria bacterium]|nr:HEAT repeat domain-containing protein [Deltaproteobacteria bacterium]
MDTMTSGRSPGGAHEHLRAFLGEGASVMGCEGVALAGWTCLRASVAQPGVVGGLERHRGFLVSAAGDEILEGSAALRVVAGLGVDDETLARAALIMLVGEGELVSGTAASAPDALVFEWLATSGMARTRHRTRLDRGSLTIVTAPAEPPPDPVSEALARLAEPGDLAWRGAVDALAGACASRVDARAALAQTATRHVDPETRGRAAAALGACPDADTLAVLDGVLADHDPQARAGAAAGLGRLGGDGAEAALRRRVPNETDDDVRVAISDAIRRIMASRAR